MRRLTVFVMLGVLAAAQFASAAKEPAAAYPASIEQARAHFAAPPTSFKPEVWWHWINGKITKEGITADLEAMKRVGIGGAYIFDIGLFDSYNKGQSITVPAGPINYNTPEWRDMMVFAAKEANRLGLKLGMHNSCGWSSSGGPWVTPEDAMKYVVWSETKVKGPSKFEEKLPRPRFAHDLALFAYPAPAEVLSDEVDSEGKRKPEVIAEWLYGFRDGSDYGFGPLKVPVVRKADMLNLTSRIAADGSLEWDVPEGQWTLLLVGYGDGGGQNRAATDSGRGREVDKYSSECFDRFFDGCLEPLIRQAGPLAGKTFKTVVIDSYEPWWTNWTDRLPEEFRKRRGYEITPYLPSLTTGVVVEDVETTERFLFDFRRTLAELMAENYSDRMVERLRQHNMELAIEPIGIGNFNFFTYGKSSSLPMGEFWYREKQLHWGVKMAASVAHVYGKPVVGAESLTAMPAEDAWGAHPYLYKPWADRAFANGINRLIFHCYAHQPWGKDVVPGMTMGPFGAFINRNQTWWDLSRDWITYVTRCQYMLQSGSFVADICAYVGEGDPQTSNGAFQSMLPEMPKGYDFDYCGRDMLAEMKVKNGRLVLPSGMSYRVLVLAKMDRMSLVIARKVQSLVRDGATVVGPKPVKSPCLMEMGEGDAAVAAIGGEVWGDCDGKTVTEHTYGKGRVIDGKPLEELLAGAKLGPDFRGDDSLFYIHRRIGDADAYFVSCLEAIPTAHTCTFRAQGRPELWRPDTGTIEPVPVWRPVKDGIEVPLRLDPAGSVFVVFPKAAKNLDPVVEVRREGGAAPPKAPDPLKVIKAEWGLPDQPDKLRDVTDLVAKAVKGYRLEVQATTEALGGDPAPGFVKTFRVTYEENGKQRTVSVTDWQWITVGTTVPPAPRPACELGIRNGVPTLTAWQPGNYRIRTASGRQTIVTAGKMPAALQIIGPWEVHFPPGWDAPETTTFDNLISWTTRPEFGIKYFSGTGTYVKQFKVAAGLLAKGRRIVLDLGEVGVIAQVNLNGKQSGVLWKPPFELDVTDALKVGDNRLVVRITNVWVNRLVGDEQFPDDVGWTGRDGYDNGTLAAWPEWFVKGEPRPEPRRKTFTSWGHNRKDTPLIESGLLGPVMLRPVAVLPVKLPGR